MERDGEREAMKTSTNICVAPIKSGNGFGAIKMNIAFWVQAPHTQTTTTMPMPLSVPATRTRTRTPKNV